MAFTLESLHLNPADVLVLPGRASEGTISLMEADSHIFFSKPNSLLAHMSKRRRDNS